MEGIDTPATQHEKEAESIYVVDGAATLTIGGKLIGEKRTNPANLTGTGVEGGTPRHISKGDYIFVPENTAHAFTNTKGRLVIMSVHLPRSGAAGVDAATRNAPPRSYRGVSLSNFELSVST